MIPAERAEPASARATALVVVPQIRIGVARCRRTRVGIRVPGEAEVVVGVPVGSTAPIRLDIGAVTAVVAAHMLVSPSRGRDHERQRHSKTDSSQPTHSPHDPNLLLLWPGASVVSRALSCA